MPRPAHRNEWPASALCSGAHRVSIGALKAALALVVLACSATPQAGQISAELERVMASRGTHADTSVIVRFDDALDLRPFTVADRSARNNALLIALQQRQAQHRVRLEPLLAALDAAMVKDLWMVNAMAATVPAFAVRQLAAAPGVARIELDSFVQGGRSQRTPAPRVWRSEASGAAALASLPPSWPTSSGPAPDARLSTALSTGTALAPPTSWNLAAVQATKLWSLGHAGQGVVVAVMDTGVDLAHPDLRGSWRGGANSWFDVHGEEALPHDALGHGTQALGVIVGAHGIGAAPAARWIAVRLYDSAGRAHMSDIHLAFQWLLDPDGDPATIDAPDVVNASWTLSGRVPGACTLEFADDIGALRSAGIVVTLAAGNDGPSPGTSSSPANNPGALSVGAVDREWAIARQSSRGPSSCDGSAFPRVLAPGVGVRTTDLSHGGQASYTQASGTSLAAPHAAGVLALLAGAFPHASVAELEDALAQGADQRTAPGDGSRPGHGLIDALAAFNLLHARLDLNAAADADTGAGAGAGTSTKTTMQIEANAHRH